MVGAGPPGPLLTFFHAAQEVMDAALAPKTIASYRSSLRQLDSFLQAANRPPLGAAQAEDRMSLCMYLLHVAKSRVRAESVVRLTLAAVAHRFRFGTCPSPHADPIVQHFALGLTRKFSAPVQHRPLIDLDPVLLFLRTMDESSLYSLSAKLMTLFMILGAWRPQQLALVLRHDVTLTHSSVTIRRFGDKADRLRRGNFPSCFPAAADPVLDPVRLTRAYLVLSDQRFGNSPSRPLFPILTGDPGTPLPISASVASQRVHRVLAAAGLPEARPCSIRPSAVNRALATGAASVEAMRKQGGWRRPETFSKVYMRHELPTSYSDSLLSTGR